MKQWILYIIKCRDGSLYTGITTDLEKRLKAHNKGTASKYTRSRKPVRLVYVERVYNGSQARKREAVIKSLPRREKMRLFRKKGF